LLANKGKAQPPTKGRARNKINKQNQYLLKILQAFEELTYFKLFLIFFILFFIYKIILNLLLVLILKFFYFYSNGIDDLLLRHSISIDNFNQCMVNENSPTPPSGLGVEPNNNGSSNSRSSNISNIEGNSTPANAANGEGPSPAKAEGGYIRDNSFRLATAAYDGVIMAIAIAAGAKLAAKAPTPATKFSILLGGVGLGALAIGTKNIMSNLTSDMGKNTYINLNNLNLQDLLNLTGNSALDLIHMLVLFQLLQLLFLSIILYNSIIMLINEDYIENILLRFLPIKIVNYILK